MAVKIEEKDNEILVSLSEDEWMGGGLLATNLREINDLASQTGSTVSYTQFDGSSIDAANIVTGPRFTIKGPNMNKLRELAQNLERRIESSPRFMS